MGTRAGVPASAVSSLGAVGTLSRAPAGHPLVRQVALGSGPSSLFAEISGLVQFILSASVRGDIK